MPGVVPTLLNDGLLPPMFTGINQQISGVAKVAAGSAASTANVVLDPYGNAVSIQGILNQVVELGAGWFTTTATLSKTSLTLTAATSTIGMFPSMAVNATGIPSGATIAANGVTSSTLTLSEYPTLNASGVTITVGASGGVRVGTNLTGFGIATVTNFAYTAITVAASQVLSTASPPYTATITGPTTGFTNGYVIGAVDSNGNEVIAAGTTYTISGHTITLSSQPLEAGSNFYCCSALWTALGSTANP